jgi:hypothetical protein
MADDEPNFELTEDTEGWPILLATRSPGQVAAQRTSGAVVFRGARSGNPSFDPVSGRFAGKKPGRGVQGQGGDVVVTQQTRTLPQGVTMEQWQRRQDAVRWAARSLAEVSPEKVKSFLESHPNVDASQVNVDLFIRDVMAAKIDDLVDILNQQVASSQVSLNAPKAYIRRTLRGLDSPTILAVTKRLEGRGWDPADIKKHVVSQIEGTTRTALDQLYGQAKPKRGRRRSGSASP